MAIVLLLSITALLIGFGMPCPIPQASEGQRAPGSQSEQRRGEERGCQAVKGIGEAAGGIGLQLATRQLPPLRSEGPI